MSSISAGLAQLGGDSDKPAQPAPSGEPTKAENTPKPESLKDLIEIEPIEVTPLRKNDNIVNLNIVFRVKVNKKALNSKIAEKAPLNADIIINDVLHKVKNPTSDEKKCPRHVKFEGSPCLKPESPAKCEKNKDAELDRLIGLVANLLNNKKCCTPKPEKSKNADIDRLIDIIIDDVKNKKNNNINTEPECEKKCNSEIAQEKKDEPAQIVDEKTEKPAENKIEPNTNEATVEKKEPINAEDAADDKKPVDTPNLVDIIKKDENKETTVENTSVEKPAENKEQDANVNVLLDAVLGQN